MPRNNLIVKIALRKKVFSYLRDEYMSVGYGTVSPNKHGNSVTIFNVSTSAQLSSKLNVLRGCVPTNQAEVD